MTFRHLLLAGLAMTCFGCAKQSNYVPPNPNGPTASIAFVALETPPSGSSREELRLASDPDCETHRVLSAYNARDTAAERAVPRTSRVNAGETLYFSPIVGDLYGSGSVRCASMVSFQPLAGHSYRVGHRYSVRQMELRMIEVRCAAVVTDELTNRAPPDLVEYPVTRASRCVNG